MKMTVQEIHDEYFSQFRGQGTSLPTYSNSQSREFVLGLQLLRAAIKKWERTDGILWNELKTTLAAESILDTAIIHTYAGDSVAAPTNMRKPPAFVYFANSDGTSKKVPVLDPLVPSAADDGVYFTGGANRSYTMHVGANIASEYNGRAFNYIYYRQAVVPRITADDSQMYIDMSDPTFAIQYMLQQRFMQSRNGFGYKTAKSEADQALANMKIENYSGQPASTEESIADSGWGLPGNQTSGFGSMEL